MERKVSAQLRSDSARSSKVIKDHEGIEAVVEVPGAGKLVLRVDRAGGYSLRGYPEGDKGGEAQSRDLLAVGVVCADGIVAVRPEGGLLLRHRARAEPRTRRKRSPFTSFLSLFP
jgi:hypothetical protein